MAIKYAGKDFPLEDNNKILEINSPQDTINGVYAVVYKDISKRYAIVAMDWDGSPSLGMRWFHSTGGHPVAHDYATWFLIPAALSLNMLLGLPLSHKFSRTIDDFLAGKITGEELRQITSNQP